MNLWSYFRLCSRQFCISSVLQLTLLCICFTKITLSLPESQVLSSNLHDKVTKKLGKKNDLLPPCQLCRTLVNSFQKGMDETQRGKFEGGDTLWEESRLGNYANSELRLVEIQEKLCSNLDKAQDQCHTFSEEHEQLIEDWWFKRRKDVPELLTFLCIDSLKVCCPPNHFGADCKPCKGEIESPCSGHGKCKGAGSRKGSGDCKCNDGYGGELCDVCVTGYFRNETKTEASESETANVWECSKCHKSCKSHCREEGPKGCEVCADGYQHYSEYGCTDIDECIELKNSPCSGNTFCANTAGSYICMECDKTCNGCNGDGPDMCDKCADGFFLKEGVCVEKAMWKKALHANLARYVTYLGLFIATCIIFKRSPRLAYLVGSIVAAYIAIAEYILGNWEDFFTISLLKSFLTL